MKKSSIRKPLLVTGGAGYVGSHACKALFGAGYLPVIYDRLSCGHAWAMEWGSVELGDLRALLGNAPLARRQLGWKPRYADLGAIIGTAWRLLQSGTGAARRKQT